MRSLLVVMGLASVATAGPSLIERTWTPQQVDTGSPHILQRPRLPSVLALPPPVAPSPGPSDAQLAELERIAERSRGADRLDLLYRLATGYAQRAMRDHAIAAYRRLLDAPGFATYARADAALYGYAQLALADNARKLVQRLLADYPKSPHVPDAYLWLADRAFEATDLVAARRYYDLVLGFPQAGVVHYARYKRAWVNVNEGKHADAMRDFEAVVASADPRLAPMALRDLVLPYVEAGKPEDVVSYFARLDPAGATDRAREVAEAYGNRHRHARTAYRAIARAEHDPKRVCEASAGALMYSGVIGQRAEILADADALVTAVPGGAVACRWFAEQKLAGLAYEWHLAHGRSTDDPRDTRTLWRHVSAIVVDPARKLLVDHNLAILEWEIAARDGGTRPLDWVAAGEALQALASATDVATTDAYENAIRAANNRPLPAPIAKRLRTGLGKIDTHRAKEMLRRVR